MYIERFAKLDKVMTQPTRAMNKRKTAIRFEIGSSIRNTSGGAMNLV